MSLPSRWSWTRCSWPLARLRSVGVNTSGSFSCFSLYQICKLPETPARDEHENTNSEHSTFLLLRFHNNKTSLSLSAVSVSSSQTQHSLSHFSLITEDQLTSTNLHVYYLYTRYHTPNSKLSKKYLQKKKTQTHKAHLNPMKILQINTYKL